MVVPTLRSLRQLCGPTTKENLDRFIPNRSASNFDYLMADGWKHKAEPDTIISPSKEAYRGRLREVFNMENPRIFAYKNKPPVLAKYWPLDDYEAVRPSRPVKRQRHIRQAADRVLDAPEFLDDYYLNLLDWGSGNFLAIALGNTVYLWNASTNATSEFVTVDDDTGPVTSVSWASDGNHIAVGLNNSQVHLWDSTSIRKLRVIQGGHESRVGSLAWNKQILTSGSYEGSIINSDVRVRDHTVERYRGHIGQVCGLRWSSSGQQLASGGTDNLLYIWDQSSASSRTTRTQWLHRFEHHSAAVRALAWCPFQSNMLASGGGAADGSIKFWNTHTGACLNSVDTSSQISSLLWNQNDRELLSSHGLPQNQLTLWKYPSMVKMAELNGHQGRVLSMAQSPDGCTVATAAADETLRIWKVFGTSEAARPTQKKTDDPFAQTNRCSIR